MNSTIKKSERLKPYLLYTILFAVLCFAVFYPFYRTGHIFIWTKVQDGISQHFISLNYWGEYLRELASNLAAGKFHLPMWDMNLGLGADIFTTLNYYAIGDPLTLLCALVPRSSMETFYGFLFMFRMYLAGISFMIYCRYMKRSETGTIIAALAYVFCSFVLLGAMKHPFFLNPMIYLPLFVMGVEKIFRKEKPYLFLVMTGITAVSNFYFLYMLTIYVFLYALVRYREYVKEDRIKRFLPTVLKFGGYYALGIGIVATLFLPIIYGFLDNGRSSGAAPLVSFSKTFYLGIIKTIFGFGRMGFWTYLGYLSIVALGLGTMFLEKGKESRKYKLAFIGMFLAICIPVGGLVMNGFSYISNRWVFLFGFFLCYMLAGIYPKMFQIQRLGVILGTGVVVLFNLFCIKLFVGYQDDLVVAPGNVAPKLADVVAGTLGPGIILAITFLAILLVRKMKWNPERGLGATLMIGVVLINVAAQGYADFYREGYLDRFLTKGQVYEELASESNQQLSQIKDTSLYRSEYGAQEYTNSGVYYGFNTTGGYYSIMSHTISEALARQEVAGVKSAFKYESLNMREELLALASVKYVTVEKYQTPPAGYQKIKSGKTTDLYENTLALPFGYTYSNYMTKDAYEKLNGVEKQKAMLQAVVLEDGIKGYQQVTPKVTTDAYSVKNQILAACKGKDGITVKDGKIVVTKYQTVTISLKKSKSDNRYLRLKGLGFVCENPHSITTTGVIRVKGNKSHTRGAIIPGTSYKYYWEQQGDLIPLDDSDSVTIGFNLGGTYDIGDFEVLEETGHTYETDIKKLGKLENIKYKDNVYTATSSFDTDQLACIPIPYSKGWKAYVDGKQVKLYQMNDMYQGVALSKGEHKIQLVYETPGMKIGLIISIISILIVVVMMVKGRKK